MSLKTTTVSYVTASEADDAQRLDNFLLKHYKRVPKSHIYRIIRKGEVRVNKKRAKASTRLALGDSIRIPPITMQTVTATQASDDLLSRLASNILFENDGLIVINKPVGIAVHGGSGIALGIIEALRQLRPKAKSLELVHRLDRETSGCLLIAKKRSVLRVFHQLFRDGEMDKQYIALVKGQWHETTQCVNLPLAKNQLQSGERMVRVDKQHGKPAKTEFSLIEQFPLAALLRINLHTGRTHQIRVHAKAIGHPLALDEKYGDKAFNNTIKQQGLKRLFLHAASLCFPANASLGDIPTTFSAPLPNELQTVVNNLRCKEKKILT